MKNLNLLICPLSNDLDALNQTFAALNSRYGITNFNITGVIGGGKFSFQNTVIENISPANVPEASFGYVIASGGGINPAISDYAPLKKSLAEKINAPSESIIFDFEICNGTFRFPKMWLMLQQGKPDDFVLATGETHTVREFVEAAFAEVGIKIEWRGSGEDEKGYCAKTGKLLVDVNPKYFRPDEVDLLLGDPSKAEKILGWKREVSFRELVKIMVEADLKLYGGEN